LYEVQVVVALTRDEDEPELYTATAPGLPGSIQAWGAPHSALGEARAALQALLVAMPPEEVRALIEAQLRLQPGDLPAGSRVERVSVRVRLDADAHVATS